MKQKPSHNEISNDIYKKSKIPIFKLLSITSAGLLIGFIVNFPLNDFIKNKVVSTLNSSPSCPISYDSLKVSTLLPRAELKNVSISGLCFNKPSQNISLSDVNISFAGPSFSPIGVKINALIKEGGTRLNITPSLSPSEININIKDSKIDSKFINKLIGTTGAFTGMFTADANIGIIKNKLSKSAIRLKSKNFIILPRTIKGFEIPRLNIKNILFKGSINKKGKLLIQEVILGDSNSPIIAEATGSINLNQRNIKASKLNIEVKFKLSKSFEELLLFFLAGKNKDSKGYYKVKLTGSLSRLNSPKFL